MLLSIRMRNIALIESLTLEFSNGLHVLSGETGAGKSIVVDAVNLVLGGRSDRELIRTGEDKAFVEAVFDASDASLALNFLKEHQIDCDGGIVTLYREITSSGRSLCRINGVVMPVANVKEMAGMLMDVHGQHEHQFLMNPQYHLRFLDDSGDDSHKKLLQDVADAYQEFIAVHRAYAKLARENQQKQYRMKILTDSLNELQKAHLRQGEEETLTEESNRFRQNEKLAKYLLNANELLSGNDDSVGAVGLAKSAGTSIHSLTNIDEEYSKLSSRFDSAYFEMEEISYEISRLLAKTGFDPVKREKVDSRLDLIHTLERKYGATIADVLHEQERIQQELDKYNSMDQQVEEYAEKHKKLLAVYRNLAGKLTESRHRLADNFSEKMVAQLRDLGMGNTVFQVKFAEREDGKRPMPQENGDDIVEFMISPNPGEPLKPLSKIASGGELSRLMLAIKSLEAERGGVGCMVFDEIDTGISGRMAQVVAEKMKMIAANRQVICVTHLPQIAAMADHQFLVEKKVEDGRTNTSVRLLSQEERISEVARMLGGADGSGASARSHAQHMIEQAHL